MGNTTFQRLIKKLGQKRAQVIAERFVEEFLSPAEAAELTGWTPSEIEDLLANNWHLSGRVGTRRGGYWAIVPKETLLLGKELPGGKPFLYDELVAEFGHIEADKIIYGLLNDLVDVREASEATGIPPRTIRYRLGKGAGGKLAKKINAQAPSGTTWAILKDADLTSDCRQ